MIPHPTYYLQWADVTLFAICYLFLCVLVVAAYFDIKDEQGVKKWQ